MKIILEVDEAQRSLLLGLLKSTVADGYAFERLDGRFFIAEAERTLAGNGQRRIRTDEERTMIRAALGLYQQLA